MSDARWRMLAVLCVGRIAMGFQFQSIATLGPFIRRDFGLDYTELGTLIGLYMLPGMFLALPSGLLGNRFGDRPVVVGGMACMILGGCLVALADGFALAALGRVLSGIGAIPIGVLMVKMVADWFHGREMVTASSFYFSGWPAGIALALVSQGALAAATGWRAVMALTAGLLLLPLLLTSTRYRAPPGAAKPSAVATARWLSLSRRELALASFAGMIWACSSGSYVVLLSFTPGMLAERGWTLAAAGQLASLHIWVSLVAMPIGGFLAERANRPNLIVTAIYALLGALMLSLPWVPWLPLPLVLIGAIGGIPAGIVIGLAAAVLRPEHRAVGFGVFYTFFYAGMGITPAVAGFARDLSGGYPAAFLVGGAAVWLGILFLGLFRWAERRGRRAMPMC